MVEIGLEEYKDVVYNILHYIKTVCEENDIVYYIAYGTLLGAVRHKGFIPWDDDIDIIMDRQNYIEFLKAMNTERNGRYQFCRMGKNKAI